MMPAAAQEFPEALEGKALPDVLIEYQKDLLATTAINQVTVVEKSRRIGITWAIAADAVLASATARAEGGMDALYIGFNLDMAREFIDACAMWAKAFSKGGSEVEEYIFKDGDKDGDRDIMAFRITFASGHEINALTSKPRSLRGRQGYVIIDEAAFHDDLPGLLKAAMALLMWGGKVLIISTHDGDLNPFNELVNDIRAKRKPYALMRITFDDAMADGLYERINMIAGSKGIELPAREEWRKEMIDFYGDDAEEELFVIPAKGKGSAISGALIEARMDAGIPVLRWSQPDSFVHEPLHIREAEALDWLEAEVKPLLAAMDPGLKSYFGQDFGRVSDLTVMWPTQLQQDLTRRPPFIVELRNIPFAQQRQILFYILHRLPRFMAGALDAGGNGAQLAEEAADEFGHSRIEQIKFSAEWYRENMPSFVRAFEDATMALPRDADVLADHRLLKKIDGVVRVPPIRTEDTRQKGKKRHGDSAIANVLAHYASITETHEYAYQAAMPRRGKFDEPSNWDDERRHGSGLGGMTGAW